MSGVAGADDDTTIVKLMSSDGHIVEMIKKHAKMSITLGNLLDGEWVRSEHHVWVRGACAKSAQHDHESPLSAPATLRISHKL